MTIKLIPWYRNLGCTAILVAARRVGGFYFYADVFRRPHLGSFWRSTQHAGRVSWLRLSFRVTECHTLTQDCRWHRKLAFYQ